jgi:hypothetical protein
MSDKPKDFRSMTRISSDLKKQVNKIPRLTSFSTIFTSFETVSWVSVREAYPRQKAAHR